MKITTKAEIKKENIYQFVDKLPIEVKKRPMWEIRKSTIDYKFEECKGKLSRSKIKNDNKIYCWMVNHIRHNFSNYDKCLDFLKTQPHYHEKRAYKILKRKFLEEIKKQYPELSKECTKQLYRMDYL